MVRNPVFAICVLLVGCTEAPPPSVDGEIIERAVKHAQDQVDRGRRPGSASGATVAESEG